MGSEAEEPKPWVKWRSMPVCPECWVKRHPDRVPARLLGGDGEECILCEKQTDVGIYVRMRVEWR